MAATMLWDRIVPSGKNAYFPFQLSAAGLNPVATVYETDDATGADPTVSAGVSVQDNGGGLYAVKVNSANMTADRTYYAVVTAGNEGTRIPLWAYAPTGHFADVLSKLTDVESDVAAVQTDVDALQTEIGDVSAETWTGLATVPADVAKALSAIYLKAKGVQDDLDNGTDGLGALKTLIDGVSTLVTNETNAIDTALTTIDNEVGAIQTDVTSILEDTNMLQQAWVDGGRLDLLLDKTVAASEAAEDLIGLASDTKTASTVFGKIAALDFALDSRIDSVDTDLGLLKSDLTAVATEIGDVNGSGLFDGASGRPSAATVAAALKVIYDAQQSSANVWDDAITGSETAGTAGKRLYDLSEDWKNGGRLDLILDEAAADADAARVSAASADSKLGTPVGASLSADIAAAKAQLVDIEADTTDIQGKLGAPVGASLSADIAAVKATVDTLAVQTNAVLLPFVPERIFSKSTEFRLSISVNVRDGKTGSLEDPDVLGTAPAGKVFVKAKNSTAGTNVALYNAPSAGSLLSAADSSGANGFLNGFLVVPQNVDGSSNPIPGVFTLHAVIPAFHRDTIGFEFFCRDGDPSGSPQFFSTFRYLEVLSILSSAAGGSF